MALADGVADLGGGVDMVGVSVLKQQLVVGALGRAERVGDSDLTGLAVEQDLVGAQALMCDTSFLEIRETEYTGSQYGPQLHLLKPLLLAGPLQYLALETMMRILKQGKYFVLTQTILILGPRRKLCIRYTDYPSRASHTDKAASSSSYRAIAGLARSRFYC